MPPETSSTNLPRWDQSAVYVAKLSTDGDYPLLLLWTSFWHVCARQRSRRANKGTLGASAPDTPGCFRWRGRPIAGERVQIHKLELFDLKCGPRCHLSHLPSIRSAVWALKCSGNF